MQRQSVIASFQRKLADVKSTQRQLTMYQEFLDGEVVTAVDFAGFTFFEVAALLNMTEDEVIAMYDRAKGKRR